MSDQPKVEVIGVLSPGDEVEQYTVTGLIGEGGMGTVYGAEHPLIGKRVAIKVLRPELAAHPQMVDRFVQEARAANQARSRYIVDIFAFGALPGGASYFVMEHLDGTALNDVLRKERPLTLQRGLAIFDGVCKGLQAAHDQGIVHRDLKPDNIYVLEGDPDDEQVHTKILDFGIAKFLDGDVKLTHAGLVMGTPAYMSPEQVEGQEVDLRADIYALGVIMFEVFTGQTPFSAPTPMALANKQVNTPPPDPLALRADLPPELGALILRCLSKQREQRPESAREVWKELQAIAQARLSNPELAVVQATPMELKALAPTVLTPPGLTPQTTPAQSKPGVALRTPEPEPETTRRAGPRRWWIALLFVVAAGGLFYLVQRRPVSTEAPAAPAAPTAPAASAAVPPAAPVIASPAKPSSASTSSPDATPSPAAAIHAADAGAPRRRLRRVTRRQRRVRPTREAVAAPAPVKPDPTPVKPDPTPAPAAPAPPPALAPTPAAPAPKPPAWTRTEPLKKQKPAPKKQKPQPAPKQKKERDDVPLGF